MRNDRELSTEARAAGRKIRTERRFAGVSVAALARTVGKSPAYVSNVEAGRRPATLDLCRDIASALHISPTSLISPAYLAELLDTNDPDVISERYAALSARSAA